MFRIWLIAGTVLAIAAGEVRADENEGLYVGAGLGDFSTEIDELDDVDIDFDEDSDASRIFAGWRFNRFFAVQLDYLDFGDSSAALAGLEISADSTGIAPSIVGTLPVGPVELFVRGGMLFYDVEIDAGGESFIDESGEDVVYSGGVGLVLLERLSLRAEYEVVEIDELDDAEAIWITAAWRF